MKDSIKKMNRRQALKGAGALIATAAAPGAWAAEVTLDESDPIAIALGYKADATQVDTKKYPKRAADPAQFCDNCGLYGARSAEWGTCTAIPGKLVAGRGWCNAWIPKT